MRTRLCAFAVALCLACSGGTTLVQAHEWRDTRSRFMQAHGDEERSACDEHGHPCTARERWQHLAARARRLYWARSRRLKKERPADFFRHHGSVANAIEFVFPDDVEEKAKAVARCESEFDIYAVSSSGRYKGLFQMGAAERERYGFAWHKYIQARAAYRYWKIAGWQPWPVCGD